MQGTGKCNDGNVISMSGYRGDMRFRSLNEVEAYWHALRRDGGVPKRSDIDPRGIENALEYAFILERIAPGLARLRIAGMHLSDLMGMEVRGMPVSSFIPPAGRTRFAEMLEEVMDAPAIAKVSLSAETGVGKPPLEGRMLLLPLVSDFGEISRVLGCFETHGSIGRAPRRFTVTETRVTRIEGVSAGPKGANRLPGRAERAGKIDSEGFKEAETMFRHAEAKARRLDGPKPEPAEPPSYLRLVKSDD